MRELEENASVVRNADHSEQFAIDELGRLSARGQIGQVEPIHAENVASQVPRGDGQPLRAVHAMLNVRVKLPTFDVPDHPDSVVSKSPESVPRSSLRVNRGICPKPATRMKAPRKQPLPHSYLGRSSVALVRSFSSLSTSMPIAVSTGGVPIAYPHISRSTSRGGVSGSSPSATALNDDIKALSPSRNCHYSFAISPTGIIYFGDGCSHSTKVQPQEIWVTKANMERTERVHAPLEGVNS